MKLEDPKTSKAVDRLIQLVAILDQPMSIAEAKLKESAIQALDAWASSWVKVLKDPVVIHN